MSCLINPVTRDQCVLLVYEGDLSRIEISAARYEANALLAARQWNRIIVDLTGLQSKLTVQELFVLARGLCEDLPRDARVAFIVRREQARNAKLIESTAWNAGVVFACFFDTASAMAWVGNSTAAATA
jgi:hypothetical protein